jgi:hypothetical protein
MYAYWAGDGPRTPAQLSTETISSKIQWFLISPVGTQSYIILHDPFVYLAAPGLNHPWSNQATWVINDVGRNNASLSLIDQLTNLFHIVADTYVPPNAEFSYAMSLAGIGNSEITYPGDPPVAGWAQLGTRLRRCHHPLPHKYIVRALSLVQGGLSTTKPCGKAYRQTS